MRQLYAKQPMAMERPIIRVKDISDPAVAVYLNLKDRELHRRHGRFIAEGEIVVRRLFQSRFAVESVLVAERLAAEWEPLIPPSVSMIVAPQSVLNSIVGFKFHGGVIACGVRRESPALQDVIVDTGPALVVVCPEVANAENLGGMLRLSAAFGATAVLLGPNCCDPFIRQAIRVSMGNVFALPIVQSTDLLADLGRLGEMGFSRVATVLDDTAEPLSTFEPPARVAVLFGNEAQGLEAKIVAACDRKLTIPMRLGTDSLNVAVAAGIILHHLTSR